MPDVADHRKAFVLVALLGVVGAGLWLGFDGTVTDAQRPRAIDSCTTITDPGRYALTADVTDSKASTCIRIRSDDVVLDGRGHRVDGVGAFGTAGVVARSTGEGPLENVTVRNVNVTDWDDGIRYIGVVDGAVVGTTTANNRVGLSLLDARDNRLADNVARGNRLRGISLLEDSANNTVVNNTASGNALFGIHLVEAGARNNTLVANTASNNEFGIVLIGAHGNVVTENTANGNRIAGIWLSAARDNRLARNAVSNRFYGIFLADLSSGNAVSNNVAASNAVGIRLRSSDGNRVVNNEVRSSSDNAILLISSDENVVSGNVGSDNARGITLIRSTGKGDALEPRGATTCGPAETVHRAARDRQNGMTGQNERPRENPTVVSEGRVAADHRSVDPVPRRGSDGGRCEEVVVVEHRLHGVERLGPDTVCSLKVRHVEFEAGFDARDHSSVTQSMVRKSTPLNSHRSL